MTAIRFEGVVKDFRGKAVLKALDLTIKDGEYFTFVGPSGSGKSTILNLIAGLESVTAGTIYFDDQPVNALSPQDRDVAMVFQSYALYPHMTVFENIAFPLRMKRKKRPDIDREVRNVVTLLDLQDKLARRPKELSGGERQRVALGRAIVRRPKVFLMDEPLSNLDARLRVEMRVELKKLHAKLRVTTVYVTHDQGEALGLSERIAVLNQGAVQQIGAPEEVYLHPVNMFVAGFMGAPSMNFIPTRLMRAVPPEINVNGIMLRLKANAALRNEDILAGIRPEDIRIEPAVQEGADPLRLVKVVLVEPAGAHKWVDLDWNGVTLKGVAGLETRLVPGSSALIYFVPEKVLLFYAQTGEAIEEGALRVPAGKY